MSHKYLDPNNTQDSWDYYTDPASGEDKPMTNNTEDNTLKPVQLCVTNNGNHDWLPTTGKGMQCYSCPLCKQRIYWSEINKKWVKVAPKGQTNGE